MFWGLILEPSKLYSQVVEHPFHISQAALDISTGDSEPCQVIVVAERKKFLICTLKKPETVQAPVSLYFKAGESISFMTNGKCNIHITGYLDPEFELEEDDDEEAEEEEEVIETRSSKKRKAVENDTKTNSKKAKKEEDSSDSDSDDADQLKKLLDKEDLDTDDNDESFLLNTSDPGDSDEDDSDEEEEEDDDEEEESEDEDAEKQANGLDTTADTTMDSSLDKSKNDSEVDLSKLSKSQRKRLKKKLAKQNEPKPQVNGVQKDKEEKKENKNLKKQEKKSEKAEEASEGKKEKKALTGGIQIEDLKVGNGAAAKSGKTVMVYYEGRLKSNNKVFDKCNKGPGFKFRLGAKEVISGWDIGLAGMKVGGVRKIVCPPAMAYGAKGSPPVIPPNSTLVFDVELKSVK